VDCVTDAECRAYLLGRLSEAEAEHLEARLLQDDEVFQAVREAEDDLFDAFARGQLTADDRARFVERFGDRTDGLAFSRALATRVRPERSSDGGSASRRPWIPLAAAAAVVLTAGAALMWRSQPGPAGAPAAKAPGVSAPTAPAGPSPIVVALSLSTSRAAGEPASVSLPASAASLQVRVRLNPADKYDRYMMELRSQADRVVWRGDDLRAAAEAGDLIVTATIPATSLEAGRYELAVRGGTDDLGFVPVRIMRTP
jgi:hypothetical protein